MCEREAKLQRLNVLRKAVPSCSKSSLAAILDHIAEHGLPELNNRKQMREAAEQQLKASATYGPAIFHKKLSEERWRYCLSPHGEFLHCIECCMQSEG